MRVLVSSLTIGKGLDFFFDPGKEILVANSCGEVKDIITLLSEEKAKQIGQAALEKVLAKHTYTHRAEELDKIFALEFSAAKV